MPAATPAFVFESHSQFELIDLPLREVLSKAEYSSHFILLEVEQFPLRILQHFRWTIDGENGGHVGQTREELTTGGTATHTYTPGGVR